MSNLRHWLWLSTRGPAPGMYAARLLEHFGTPEGAYFASEAAYDQVPDLPRRSAGRCWTRISREPTASWPSATRWTSAF